jgi:hypothetical protein
MSDAKKSKKNDLIWSDISSEEWRSYRFPGDEIVEIIDPDKLCVSENGHRIVDCSGRSHYVPKGWIHLIFKADPPYSF